MTDEKIKEYLSFLEKLVDHKFAYQVMSFIMIFDMEFQLIFRVNLLIIDNNWLKNNIKIGTLFLLLIIFILFYQILLPAATRLYNAIITKLIINNTWIKSKLEPEEDSKEKRIFYEFVIQYAAFSNNSVLNDYAKLRETWINNWFVECRIYFSFCVISIFYMFYPGTMFKTICETIFNSSIIWQIILYGLFGIIIIWKLYEKTLRVPSRNLYIVSSIKAKEINDFILDKTNTSG